jgi:hypothetical protein
VVRFRSPPPGTWSSTQAQAPSGAFESVQRVELPGPVVEYSVAGARRLGELYWRELERSTRRLVRVRGAERAPELRLLGVGPPLLRLGEAEVTVAPELVRCAYAICGGVLARGPGGTISFTQAGGNAIEIRATLTGFLPRLASRRRRRWNGLLYAHGQARLHVAAGRSYLARLWQEAAR